MYEIETTKFANIDLFYFSSFILKKSLKNHYLSLKKATLQKKNVIVEKEVDCIDIDNTGNLEDSARLVFNDGELGNLIVVNDGVELTRSINQMKKSEVLQ